MRCRCIVKGSPELAGTHVRSLMHDKTKAHSWTWIPADPPSRRLSRIIGAMVLAATCLTAGVVLGRMSVTGGSHLHNTLPRAVQPSPVPAPPPPPVRAATESAPPQPTMALKSEPEPEEQRSSAAGLPPNPPVLLNPGTVKTRDFSEEKAKATVPATRGPVNNHTIVEEAGGSKPENVTSANDNRETPAKSKKRPSSGNRTRWESGGTRRRSSLPEQSAPRSPAPSLSRDYQDLRAYMLGR
jgi:hypothetical protein